MMIKIPKALVDDAEFGCDLVRYLWRCTFPVTHARTRNGKTEVRFGGSSQWYGLSLQVMR